MAANAPIGANFWEGVIGVVNVTFDTVAMGKTTEDTEIEYIEDIKDINFAQDGTQPADKVRTGQAYQVVATFGQITTTMLEKLMPGHFTKSVVGNSAKLSRQLYRSLKDNEAAVLTLTRVDSDGQSSTDDLYILNFYEAAPMITGNFQFGADTQRNLQVTWYCFWNSTNSAFGYSGYATSLSLIPVA